MKKIKSILILLTVMIFNTASFNASVFAESAVADKIEVTDIAKRKIEVDKPVTKIVATLPSDAEILFALGLGDTLVGRGSVVNYPEEVKDIPEVGIGQEMNVEEILKLNPELVILHQTTPEDQIKQIEDAGVKVLLVNATDLEGVYENIRQLAILTGHKEEGEDLISDMAKTFGDYKGKAMKKRAELKMDEPTSVYFEISPLEYGLWTGGKNTFFMELAEIIGLKNAFEDIDGWAELSEEQVLKRDPDYMVSLVMGDKEDVLKEIKGRKGWDKVKFVAEDNHILVGSNDIFSRPGPRLVDAVKELYDFVYGESAE